jgi:hypothetical protein
MEERWSLDARNGRIDRTSLGKVECSCFCTRFMRGLQPDPQKPSPFRRSEFPSCGLIGTLLELASLRGLVRNVVPPQHAQSSPYPQNKPVHTSTNAARLPTKAPYL